MFMYKRYIKEALSKAHLDKDIEVLHHEGKNRGFCCYLRHEEENESEEGRKRAKRWKQENRTKNKT